MFWFTAALSFSLFSTSVLAQQSINNFTSINPNECVAPNEYLSCYEDVVVATSQCMNFTSDNPTAQKGCGCTDGERKINCFASACWNRIYSCEYQSQVADYLTECSLPAPEIPYWPSPNNVPGECSCNTGVALETVLAAETSYASCLEGAIGSAEKAYECSCCWSSISISTLYDVCPKTDPTLIGLNLILGSQSKYGFSWSNCGQYLQNVDCVGGLGYAAPLSTGSVYNPTNTPPPGTQTLFDEPGEMSTPASGAVFTWYGYNSAYSYVVSAVSSGNAVATAGTAGATATKGSGVTATKTASATSTESSSSGSTTKNAAPSLQPTIPVLVNSVVVLGLFLLL